MIQPEEPSSRAMSAGTMKIPEPIIEPATIIVASSRPKSRTKPFSDVVPSRTFPAFFATKLASSQAPAPTGLVAASLAQRMPGPAEPIARRKASAGEIEDSQRRGAESLRQR